jgi:hypothetical protein
LRDTPTDRRQSQRAVARTTSGKKIDAGRSPRPSQGMVTKAVKEADTCSTLTVLLN